MVTLGAELGAAFGVISASVERTALGPARRMHDLDP